MRGSLWCFPVFLFLFLPSLLPCTLAHAADFSLPPQTFTFDGTSYTYSPSSDRFSSPSGLVSPEETRLLKALLHFANPEERVRSLLPMTLHQVRYQAYCFSTGADSDPQGGFFYANQESWEKHRLRVLVLDGAGHPVKDQETLRTLFHAYATGSRFSQPYPYHNADSLDSDRPSPASLLFVQTVSSDLATQLVFADQALAQYFTDLLKGGGRIQVARYEAALQQMLLREETDLSLDLGSEIAYRLHDEGGTYCSLLSEAISAGRYSPHSQVLAKVQKLEYRLDHLEKKMPMKVFLLSSNAINLILALAEKEAYFEKRVEVLERLSGLLHQREDANPDLLQAVDGVLAQAQQTREEEIFRHLSDFLSEYASTEVIGRTQEEIIKAVWKGSQPGARTLARHLLASAVAQASLGLSVSNFLWGMDAIYANAINAQSAMEIKEELKRLYDRTYHRERLQSSYPAEYCQDLTALASFIRLCNASFYQNVADIAGSSALKTTLVDQFANLMGGLTLSGAIEQNRQVSAAIQDHLENELLSPPGVEYAMQESSALSSEFGAQASLSLEPSAAPQLPVSFREPVTGMEFILVKGGCFQMGDTFGDGELSEKPVHEVCVDDFYIGKYEVTQGQWKAIMGDSTSDGKEDDNYPTVNVSWSEVQKFLQELNRRADRNYRLLSEAEWEYAARSGGRSEKWAGTNIESELEAYAWYDQNSAFKRHPMGQKKPNSLGLYDMSGNVWEIVADWGRADYYSQSPKYNPPGPPSGQWRVLRGGSFADNQIAARCAFRFFLLPAYASTSAGFRVALSSQSAKSKDRSDALLWRYTTSKGIISSPAVADGMVYVGCIDGKLYALDAKSGALQWTYAVDTIIITSPAVADGILYVRTYQYLYALDAKSGALQWKYTTMGNHSYTPAVANGIVYVSCGSEKLYALDAKSGALQWTYAAEAPIISSPAVANGIVYVSCGSEKLYALDAKSGALQWTYAAGSTPAVANGTVYVSCSEKLYALDAKSGALLWSYAAAAPIISSAAVLDEIVCVLSEARDHNLYALDAKSGALQWVFTMEVNIYCSRAVVGEICYVNSGDGKLYALDAKSGALQWSYTPGSYTQESYTLYSPTASNGICYVGLLSSNDGKIYALRIFPRN